MSEPLCEIKISDIDLSDNRYQISLFQTDTVLLAQSILEAGMITPVVLLPVQDYYIIICGFNRVKAVLLNKAVTITARLIKPDTTEPGIKKPDVIKPGVIKPDCLVIAISAASFKRPLSQVELIKSLILLSKFMDAGRITQKSGALFNTQLNQKYINDLIAIGKLGAPALDMIASGHLSIKAAKKISLRNTLDISVFLLLFGEIKASTSVQLEMILYLTEISKRDKISLKDVFKTHEIQTILEDESKDLILKTKQLRDFIYKMRFPTLFQARQNVTQQISSLGLGGTIKIEPPPNLEAQQIKFSFTAKTHQQFVQHFNKLAAVSQKQELKDIFNT